MSGSAAVVWDDALVEYDFGPGHPMSPVRLDLAMRLVRGLGLLDSPGASVVPPVPVPPELLLSVHDADYVAAVQAAAAGGEENLARGLGTDDVPVFAGMHEASLRVCGATLAAAQRVLSGEASHAVNLAGGLHHAMPGSASGFCVYNDLAVAIRWLLDNGVERVAYVDVDVHHGDGVQTIFYDDPRVLTISLHESGRALFPGTGFPDETGGPGAEGGAVNLPLPPGTGDDGWLRAFHAIVPQLLEAFGPQVLVTQHGCDSHRDDPLAHLALTVDGQRASYAALHKLAHRFTDGRWIATGGGGYSWVSVVPRAWAHLVGEVVGAPVAPETVVPESWRVAAMERCEQEAPRSMTDGAQVWLRPFDTGYDPGDRLDSAILATRSAVFPLHGLVVDRGGW
ncbi:MAG TPA: acetoin utilization protein AcuC [Candidatus Nanopelagicales bacterium]|nr:acetoin utilization protein AcuC [Candidatus Nanopelagicales bacterium]